MKKMSKIEKIKLLSKGGYFKIRVRHEGSANPPKSYIYIVSIKKNNYVAFANMCITSQPVYYYCTVLKSYDKDYNRGSEVSICSSYIGGIDIEEIPEEEAIGLML